MPGTEARTAGGAGRRRLRWPVPAAVLAITALVLGPLLVGGGIALRGDMVFVPDQPWKPAWLGLDGSVPRAVPMDALVALADEVVPGALLQRLLLAGALLAAGLGIARMARDFGTVGQVAAVVVYLWNPWVHGRLEIGQWPTVLGYGLLPWLVLAARRARDGAPGGLPATALLLVASAVCAPSIGLLGVVVALAVVAAGGRRPLLATAGLGLLANLPWAVPALIGPSIHGNDLGFSAFAARGETPLGTFASLLSMGGIWKTSVVAPERTHGLVVAAAAGLALVLLAAFRHAAPLLGRRTTLALGSLGAAAFGVAFLPSLGPVARALDALAVDVPAIALLRDSQRFLAPFGLVLALGAAALVHRLLEGVPGAPVGPAADRSGAIALTGVVLLAPVLLLPSMTWGLGGDLSGADYPEEWSQVAEVLEDASGYDGAVVALPWRGSYRGFAWNDDRAVLDPAPRFLPGEVLLDDRVFLRGRVVPGEDPYLADVGRALDAADPAAALGALGVRWVLVEKENGPVEAPAGAIVHDGPGLRLVDLGTTQSSVENPRHEPAGWPVSLANAITASVVVISIWFLTRRLWG